MGRLLRALALGIVLWTLAAPIAAMEPTGAGPNVVMAQIDGASEPAVRQLSLLLPEVVRTVLADPNVAFLLLILAAVGIVAEVYHPGGFVAGIVGIVSLLLALVACGNLPTNWGAAALLGFSLMLFLLEVHLPSHGVLGAGGVVAFLLGGFLLFAPPTPTAPAAETVEVNRWLLLGTSAVFAGFFLLVLRVGLRARRLPVVDTLLRLPGALGVASSALEPRGTVSVFHESWSAVTSGPPIEAGEQVEVVSREGLTLRVRPKRAVAVTAGDLRHSQGEVRPGLRVERTG